MKQTGTQLVPVPYRGGPAALNDLMGGSIDVLIEVLPVVMEQIKTGAVKGLAVSSPYRLPSIPQVPTFKEAGVSGVELTGWLGIYGHPQMPDDIRARLGAAIADIVKQPDSARHFPPWASSRRGWWCNNFPTSMPRKGRVGSRSCPKPDCGNRLLPAPPLGQYRSVPVDPPKTPVVALNGVGKSFAN